MAEQPKHCEAKAVPENGCQYTCTLPPGHEGNHKAYGISRLKPLCEWPQGVDHDFIIWQWLEDVWIGYDGTPKDGAPAPQKHIRITIDIRPELIQQWGTIVVLPPSAPSGDTAAFKVPPWPRVEAHGWVEAETVPPGEYAVHIVTGEIDDG